MIPTSHTLYFKRRCFTNVPGAYVPECHNHVADWKPYNLHFTTYSSNTYVRLGSLDVYLLYVQIPNKISGRRDIKLILMDPHLDLSDVFRLSFFPEINACKSYAWSRYRGIVRKDENLRPRRLRKCSISYNPTCNRRTPRGTCPGSAQGIPG